ncbi:hypothetical protein [Enterocloster hominis (ex Hitch et al. 2024)]|uniref:hypothetical protein n=1 Tax=Enterocloster hominis (ex Hitch et al. 2024) TaxID=1917870 RepID=UPI003B4FFAA2
MQNRYLITGRPHGYLSKYGMSSSDERNKSRYEEFAGKYGIYGVFELPEGAVYRHHDEQWKKTSFRFSYAGI